MPVTRGTARQPKNAPPPEPEEVEEVAEEEQEEEVTEEEQEEETAEEQADEDEGQSEEVDGEQEEEEEEAEESDEESDESASEPETETPSQPRGRGRPRNPETPEPKPPISKAEKAALFNEWESRRALVLELREHLDNAKKEVSAACFDIYDKLGKGPFRWKGKVLKAVKSKNSPAASIRVVSDEAEDIG